MLYDLQDNERKQKRDAARQRMRHPSGSGFACGRQVQGPNTGVLGAVILDQHGPGGVC
jgi:hypothetical protein